MHQYDSSLTIPLRQVAAPAALRTLPRLLKVLADPVRFQIVALLARRELCVCDIEALLGVSQSMTSHHLGVLRRAGLALSRRDPHDGRWVYYRLDPVRVAELKDGLDGILYQSRYDPTPARCD